MFINKIDNKITFYINIILITMRYGMFDYEDDNNDFYNQSVINHIPQQQTYTHPAYVKHTYNSTDYTYYNDVSPTSYSKDYNYNLFGNTWNNTYDKQNNLMIQIVDILKKQTGHEYKFSTMPNNDFINHLYFEDNNSATQMCPQMAPGCNEWDYYEGPNIFIDIQKSNVYVIDFEVNHDLDNRFTFLLEELRNELKEHIEDENKILQIIEEQGINDYIYESDNELDKLYGRDIHIDKNLFGSKLPNGYSSPNLSLEEYNVISREEYDINSVSFDDETEHSYFSLSNIFPFSVVSNLYSIL
jgi:hypothetical protein